MQTIEALKTIRHLDAREIEEHLKGVEYIIMAAPIVGAKPQYPIQFTIFLNTKELIPGEIQEAILDKFVRQYHITAKNNVFSGLDNVAFAVTNQETPMPLHLVRREDKISLPSTIMHVIDFEGDSPDFQQARDGLTGWSYSYDHS